ncbi:MAG: YraN family protein [Nitrospirota bacterium]|nr:YraN family protein [Nitrospirota bacterium]
MKPLGSEGEDLAVRFLQKKGYRIIARNYKTPVGEIDIIARDGDTIVFIEVKTRTDISFGYPFEAVNKRKRQKLKNLALLYLKRQGKESPVRFDVLSIFCMDNGKKDIEHIKDAFEV